jgi:excinuclease UvrABC nuclease subunit
MPIIGDKYAFTQENVNKAPEEHGVYQLFDGEVTIYYGRASGDGVTIRSRLQSHRKGSEGKCTQSATHYRREVTSRPIARERELLEEHQTKTGRLPHCNERAA